MKSHPGPDRGDHHHLWQLPDGTCLHAPPGDLTIDEATGRLCCHLCGNWYVSLGSHVHTAATYRTTMGLCVTEPLTAAHLSQAIADRQHLAYQRNEHVRERLATTAAMLASGELSARSRTALQAPDPPQRVARRRAALQAGRKTIAAHRQRDLTDRLTALGFNTLDDYLRTAYTDGASVEELARTTGLGRQRLRTALDTAGVQIRATGHNTTAGKRSRAASADEAAAQRVGTTDLRAWLRDRYTDDWTLTRLAAAVGHSTHWIRWRLASESPDTQTG
ncbi:hypothetical protein AB0H83_25255 [Dactylosporangium sp. NPDC050688]|uniref:hypothetical protein n=1 Tax=Dactylosporangium sp. NPDC050688 TaxID=3157217 RepID=UPI003400DBDF